MQLVSMMFNLLHDFYIKQFSKSTEQKSDLYYMHINVITAFDMVKNVGIL